MNADWKFSSYLPIPIGTEGLPNLSTKEKRNLHAVPNPLLDALANGAGRGLNSGAVVVKTNEAPAARESRHCIMLACDGGATKELLFVFV